MQKLAEIYLPQHRKRMAYTRLDKNNVLLIRQYKSVSENLDKRAFVFTYVIYNLSGGAFFSCTAFAFRYEKGMSTFIIRMYLMWRLHVLNVFIYT